MLPDFGMPMARPGETPAEYQARYEDYRRRDREDLPRDLAFLAAAGRGDSHVGRVPLYPSDHSEEAVKTVVRRMYSASWAR